MEDNIKYSITTSNGEAHEVSKKNIDKYGIKAYADSYQGATIRMRDTEGADYDIPLEHYDDATRQGLNAYVIPPRPALVGAGFNGATGAIVASNKVTKLYNAFVNEGYDMEPEAEFRKNLQNPKKRRAAYDALVNKGYNMEPFEQFEKNIGFASSGSELPTGSPHAAAWTPTWRQRAAMRERIEGSVREIDATGEAARQRMGNMMKYNRSGAALSGEPMKARMVFNPTTGKMEQNYITPYGDETTDIHAANQASREYRAGQFAVSLPGRIQATQRHIADLKRRINERADAALEEAHKFNEEKLNGPLGSLVHGHMIQGTQQSDSELEALRLALSNAEDQLRHLQNARDRQQPGNEGFWRGYWRGAGQSVSDIRAWDFGFTNLRHSMTTKRIADKLEKGEELNAAETTALEDMVLTDAVMSEFDLGRGYRWGDITGSSVPFMSQFALTGGFGGLSGVTARGVTAAATRYMPKFATRAATRLAQREVLTRVAERGFINFVKKEGTAGVTALLKEQALPWTVKALGTTADDLLVRAPLMANTVQGGQTLANVVNEKIGDAKYDPETGQFTFADGTTWSNAVWQGEADQVIENFSEMWGAHLPGLTQATKAFGARKLTAAILRNTRSGAGTVLSKTANFLERAGVNGYFGEVGEEYYGQLWRTMLGVDTAYDENGENLFKSGQFHGDIWGGMALSVGLTGGGAMAVNSGLKYGGKVVDYYTLRNALNRTNRRATQALTADVWDPMRTIIDVTDNANIGALAEQVWGDEEMTPSQKTAVLNYMEATMVMRGKNLRDFVTQESEEEHEGRAKMADAYTEGINIESAEDRNRARMSLNYQAEKLRGVLGAADDADIPEVLASMYGADDINEIVTAIYNDERMSENNRAVFIDYLTASNRYNGMVQTVNDGIEAEIAEQEQFIDEHSDHSDKENPVVRPATLRLDDEQVFIIGGDVRMLPDGTMVDLANSDRFIIVRRLDGSVDTIDSADIRSIAETESAAAAKERMANETRNTRMAELMAQINGTVSANPGDAVPVQVGDDIVEARVVSNDGAGDVTVSMPDQSQVTLPLAEIQALADMRNEAAFREEIETSTYPQTEARTDEVAGYELNEEVRLEGGLSGRIVEIDKSDPTEAQYVVEYTTPNGDTRVMYKTAEDLTTLQALVVPQAVEVEDSTVLNTDETVPNPIESTPNPIENPVSDTENVLKTESTVENVQQSALSQIPTIIDARGKAQHQWTAVEPELAWDGLVERTADEEMAQTFADNKVDLAQKTLDKAQKVKPKAIDDLEEFMESERHRKQAIAEAQAQLDAWKRIAAVAEGRHREAERQRDAEIRAAAEYRRQQEEAERARRDEEARILAEELNGVPEWTTDTPADARRRGHRRVAGTKVERQGEIPAVVGKEVDVNFAKGRTEKGRAVLIDATHAQPSHLQGNLNPLHFIPEAQPKDRNDDGVSTTAADDIAREINPRQITATDVTAYVGAPTVNRRGEVIQGNNRVDALRLMWERYPEQAAKYKQYLIDNAAAFGLNPADIEAMERPILANMLEVDDDAAIKLGQYTGESVESGGEVRLSPTHLTTQLGKDMPDFVNLLLRSNDEEATLAQLIDSNGLGVFKWLSEKGYITPTQYKTALDSRGNINAEAKNDLKDVLFESVFKGGAPTLKDMFSNLPVAAQNAILSTAFRDQQSPHGDKTLAEIQESIIAYNMMASTLAVAKNHEQAMNAMQMWKTQTQFDDISGEPVLPSKRFSNFALQLAAMYHKCTQRTLQGIFNRMFDLVQGTAQPTLFEPTPSNEPIPLTDAIKRVLGIEYQPVNNENNDGQIRDNDVVVDAPASEAGQPRGTTDTDSGEQSPQGEESADRGAGASADSGSQKPSLIEAVKTLYEHGKEYANKLFSRTFFDVVTTPEFMKTLGLTGEKFTIRYGVISKHANKDSDHALPVEIWEQLPEALQNPFAITKHFEKKKGNLSPKGYRIYTALQHDGKYIIVGADVKNTGRDLEINAIATVFAITTPSETEEVIYTSNTITPEQQALLNERNSRQYPAEREQSADKVTTLSVEKQTADAESFEQFVESLSDERLQELLSLWQTRLADNGGEWDMAQQYVDAYAAELKRRGLTEAAQPTLGAVVSAAEAETDTNPTERQKEAGNYKKGHVQIGTFDVSIENPKGSIRRGTDANGKEWQTEMQNTYGYIRGTEGVDGDHIDVFLSDNPEQGDVFVVDQYNPDGSFDEHKVMYGFADSKAARDAYLTNYEQGWGQTRRLDVTGVSKDEFKKWIGSSKRKTKPFAEYKSVIPIENNGVVGRSLTENEATIVLSRMEELAEEAPQLELTPENWIEQFGEDGRVSTPIGEVKLGENQFIKLFSRKRAEYFGMMYPTLNTPDVVIEKNAPTEGAERDTKLLFVKTFVKPDGGRIVHFESITVQRDGMEVSVSSHEADAKDIKKDMQKERILHISEMLSLGSEWSLTEAPRKAEGPDLVPTPDNISSESDRLLYKATALDESANSSAEQPVKGGSPSSNDKVNTFSEDKQGDNAESSHGYTITPATYTNKKGKQTPMHRLTFGRELTKEEETTVKKFASEKQGDGRFAPARGWKDRENGGWLFRTEEDARKAGAMLDDAEAVADARPLSREGLNTNLDKEPSKQEQSSADFIKEMAEKAERGESPYTITPEVERQLAEQHKAESEPYDDGGYSQRHEITEKNGYKVGEKVWYTRNDGKGKRELATIVDFGGGADVTLDTGMAPVMYEACEWSQIEKQKPQTQTKPKGIFEEAAQIAGQAKAKREAKKSTSSKKKQPEVKPEQPIGDLFSGFFAEENINNEQSGQATDEFDEPINKKIDGNTRKENTRTDNSGSQFRQEELPSSDKVGTAAPVQDSVADSQGERRRPGVGSRKSGTRPQYDVTKDYTNEEIHEIASSVATIKDDKVEITGNVTDDIKAICRQYKSGGIAKKGRGVLDEYYTDGKIVDAVGMLIAPYFKGKSAVRVLEPSVGIGNFIGALQGIPTSEVQAFEINETTARIAKILHPNVEVNLRSFETEFIDESGNKKPLPEKFNLIIGNPPYGSHRGFYKGLGEESKIARYEDYFVKRSLDVLHDGAVLAMVLPSSWIDRHTKYGGYTVETAYRLPSGAFESTQVGTDIVILRKDSGVPVSAHTPYFEQHPGNICGEVRQRKGRFGKMEEYVAGDIDAAIEKIGRENARRMADELGIESTADSLNEIQSAIEETGDTDKAVPIIKEEKAAEIDKAGSDSQLTSSITPNSRNRKYKVELRKGTESVPTSLQFQHSFSDGEIEAFEDTNYDGTLDHPSQHSRYANYIGGKFVHDFYYAEGDIYSKLEQLAQDKPSIIDAYGEQQYEKQKNLLESVLPKLKDIDEITISPNTTFVKNLRIITPGGPVPLRDMFIDFCRKLPYQAFGSSSSWEVVGYVQNEQVYGQDKQRNQLVRERRKKVANDLFAKFLNDELSEEERKQIVYAFNREYNSTYRPDYSKVPMFSTINKEFKGKPLKLTSVQLAGVGRMTVKGVGVLAHEVGFGKTLSGVLAMHEAMTRGFARKPLIVVPNDNILKQWVETIGEVLPHATVNMLGNLGASYDLTGFRVNDFEFTIVTYEGLKAMSFSDDTYNRLSDRFSYITEDLKKHQSERDAQKEIEKRKELKGKMKRGAKPNYMFEDFGFDYLTFDEVHNANHIVSKVRLDKSIASDFRSQSQRTSDLGLKTWIAAQYIQEMNDGRNVLLLSATPFTNKPLEYYSILSLVGNDMLARKGFFNVDQFFATFMEADNELEIGANGRPIQKTNVRKFRNNGLFQQLLSEFIDIKGEEDNPDLERPGRHNREYRLQQNDLTTDAIASAQDLLSDNDTVLQGIGHARAAAFSPYATSLLGLKPKSHKDFVENSPKIYATVRMIEQNMKDRPDAGQIVYSEVGVEFFPLIRDYLVKESGFKPEEVRIITGATSNTERINIQTAFNNGEIKVVIGSPAIKEGLNLQGNTTDMYILSLPWNFTQLRQIEGRGWRQGNRWNNIRINYMLTDDSVDVFMLQRLQTKQELYNEAMKRGAESVDVSDIDTSELKTALITDPGVRAEIVTMQERSKLNQEKTQIEADLAFVMRKYKTYNDLVNEADKNRNLFKRYTEYAQKEGGYWVGAAKDIERTLTATEKKINQEKQRLLDKGIDVDDIVRQIEESQNSIKAIDEKIDNLKDFEKELADKYRKESLEQGPGETLSSYLSERKKENQGGFYSLRRIKEEEISRGGSYGAASDTHKYRDSEGDRLLAIRALTPIEVERNNAQLTAMSERDGKPFEHEKELEEAKARLAEYTEKMKAEMAEKEAKYADIDATVEAASNVQFEAEDEEEESKDKKISGDKNRYRSVEDISGAFDADLERYKVGELEPGYRFELGMPSTVLRKAGFPELPITMRQSLLRLKSGMGRHPFEADELKGLVEALQKPIAVFSYSKDNIRNVIVDLKHGDKHFLVGVTLDYRANGIEVNSISGLFPKESHEWLKWIQDGKAILIGQKEKVQNLVNSLRMNPAEAERIGLNLDDVAKIIDSFENPTLSEAERLNYDAEIMRSHGAELAARLHTSVRFVDNFDDIIDNNVEVQREKRRSKGWYDTATGEVVIALANCDNVADVEATIFHEVVGHKGLRQVIGGEHFGKFLREVYEHASKQTRTNIVALMTRNGWDVELATEEYIASLAERGFEDMEAQDQSFWQKVCDKVKKFLARLFEGAKIPKSITIGESEIRYMLWRTYQQQTDGSLVGEAENVLMQQRLGVGRFRFSNGADYVERNRALARRYYESRVSTGAFQFTEAFQDSMLGLKRLYEAIEQGSGENRRIEDIPSFENAYLAENALSSLNQAEMEAYERLVMQPLLNVIPRLAGNERERQQLMEYMMAKHGLERNAYMRREAANNKKKTDRDFAGLIGLTREFDWQSAEIAAQQMVDDYEQSHSSPAIDALWARVNDATKATLQKVYECGILSQEQFDKISQMYQYYIPLRGWEETTSDDIYGYLTARDGAFNGAIKKAEGRSSKADDPIATIANMAESAIIQGNRNRMKQRFLNYVLNHPSDLVSVNKLWVKYDDVADEWIPVFADIKATDTPAEVERKIQDFERKMERLRKAGPDKYKRGREASRVPYKVVKGNLREHQVIVKRGGEDYVLTINGNPRAAQAVNGMTNPDNEMKGGIGDALKGAQWVNRQLSNFYTTRNPDFVVSNFIRDAFYSNSMVWIKESPRYALKFHKNFAKVNPAMMLRLLALYRNNNLDLSNPKHRMFYEFMMNGGETGYTMQKDVEQQKKAIKKALKKSRRGRISAATAWEWFGEKLDDMNRGVENCARFAAYVTSREVGRDVQRAVFDAKEISVNFNKKGAGAKFLDKEKQSWIMRQMLRSSDFGRVGFVFWNAAIQGTVNFAKNAKRHPAKAMTAATALFMLGVLVAAMGGSGDDDDASAYFNQPDYVRRSNLMFKVGNQWVAIPLPVEHRAIYGLGELCASVCTGKEEMSDWELAKKITAQVSQLMPLDFMEGQGGMHAFTPSAVKPVWEAYVSETGWTGLPLYKDTPYNKNMPEWTKSYASANHQLVGLSAWANVASGGDDYTKGWADFNPAKVEYMLKGYFGGYANVVDKLVKTGETMFGSREYDPRNILLLNRVLKKGDERTANRRLNSDYYRYYEEYQDVHRRLKAYENERNNGSDSYRLLLEALNHTDEKRRHDIFDEYLPDIRDIRTDIKEATNPDSIRMFENELAQIKRLLVNRLKAVGKNPANAGADSFGGVGQPKGISQ